MNGKTLVCNVQVRPNQQSWKVVTRAGYYRSTFDDYMVSKVKYNANGSLTVEGYFLKKVVDNFSQLAYNKFCSKEHVRLAQLDRAFGYGPKGREFESSNARI